MRQRSAYAGDDMAHSLVGDADVRSCCSVERSHQAATVEVDVMPFLARVDVGGPFDKYYSALQELGSDYVRFAPWFGYPKVRLPRTLTLVVPLGRTPATHLPHTLGHAPAAHPS